MSAGPITSDPGFDIPVELRLLDGQREKIRARIARVNTGFIRLRSPLAIREDRRLELLYEGRTIKAEVVYCQKKDLGGYHVGLRIASDTVTGTIRKELRLPVNLRGTLNVAGSAAPISAKIVDMSQSGLGLILPKAVAPGMSVSVDLGHGVAFGEICYCTAVSRRTYRAGFQLEEFLYRDAVRKASNDAAKPRYGRLLALLKTIRNFWIQAISG